MADEAFASQRVEIFSAGCELCNTAIARVREIIDPRHEMVVHDMLGEEGAPELAEALGIHSVPAVVVNGELLACCRTGGPTRESLVAAGLGR